MTKKYHTSLFIFRRDLRLTDNTAINEALNRSDSVIPCFIFNPEQVGPENSYRSLNAIQCMLQSLEELNEELIKKGSHLYLFFGKPHEIIAQIHASTHLSALFFNKDYTPYSRKRDEQIAVWAKNNGVDFVSCDDTLLQPPGVVLNAQGKPYEIFTPFFKRSITLPD